MAEVARQGGSSLQRSTATLFMALNLIRPNATKAKGPDGRSTAITITGNATLPAGLIDPGPVLTSTIGVGDGSDAPTAAGVFPGGGDGIASGSGTGAPGAAGPKAPDVHDDPHEDIAEEPDDELDDEEEYGPVQSGRAKGKRRRLR